MERGLVPIEKFCLPPSYFVIHPFSDFYLNTDLRNMTQAECGQAIHYLAAQRVSGVVLNKTGKPIAWNGASLIDLTNKTTVLEALEITKGAEGFIGCASFISVLASRTMPPLNLFIKGDRLISDGIMTYDEYDIFYAPIKTRGLLRGDLLDMGLRSPVIGRDQ